MKEVRQKKDVTLRGVSTLDVFRKISKTILPGLLLLLALSSLVFGRPGHSILDLVDPAFNPQIQTNSFISKSIRDIKYLPDGKLLISGDFNTYNRQPVVGLVRLNADATLDTTFNHTLFDAGSNVGKIVIQPDGKLILNGYNMTVNGHTFPEHHVIRVSADGIFDPTFNFQEGNNIYDIDIDASGRLILSGALPAPSFSSFLIRLNSDGSIDNSFQSNSVHAIIRIATQNNKVLIYTMSEGIVSRINEDGTLDNTFTPKQMNSYLVSRLIVQPDEKILVLDSRNLQRINANGGDDTSFTKINFPIDTRHMALGNDGTVTTSLGNNQVQIKRFLSNGNVDSSFTPYHLLSGYSYFGLYPDGRVIIGDAQIESNTSIIRNSFSRLFPDGSLDPSFNPGGIGFQSIIPGQIRTITIQPDGKIIIGGRFDSVNETSQFKLVRLNSDATVDENFQINTSNSGNRFTQINDIYKVALQSDGKLIVSGSFTYTLNGVAKQNIVRLNSDGSIDTTFNLSLNIPEYYGPNRGGQNKSIPQSDGKIFVATSRVNLTEPIPPLRLNADGTKDNSFNSTLFNESRLIYSLDAAIQPDGKILFSGIRRTDIGTTQILKSFLARLNADGSLDPTFQNLEVSNKEITAFNRLPNGKILTVTSDPSSGGVFEGSVVQRLNSDGSPDSTFNVGTSADGKINVILALPTGKIFVGGKFTGFNGEPRQNLAQLNADGSLNQNTYSLNNEVLSLAVDSDGRVLVGGSFTVINAGNRSSNRSYVARLIDSNYTGVGTRFDFDGDGRADLGVFDNSNGNWSIFESQANHAISTHFGSNGDKLAPADFDGDGKADIAVFRPAEGVWYLLRSEDGFAAVRWGQAGDKPVPADYDGDGLADIAVWRPSDAVWYILRSSNNKLLSIKFGLEEDIPIRSADFDGDGTADIAVWRPSEGNFYWLESGSNYNIRVVHFGQTGDIPAVADYNGDGKSDLVVFRPTEGNWYQFLTSLTNEYAFSVTKFGTEGDEPVAADYDGDGNCDIAVRRGNVWHILKSKHGYKVSVFANTGETAIASSQNQ